MSTTISGVQMTLVAGIIFVLARRLLAIWPTLALNYPIKKWAAAVAMAGSVFYDIATGSRVGTERALIMTLIVLSAVIMNRRALKPCATSPSRFSRSLSSSRR